jgi:hypothetical protein
VITIASVGAGPDLDAVIAIEAEAFSSPWTREMYLAELENVGVSFCFLARDEAGGRSASVRSGVSSTSCTSTTWRWCRLSSARYRQRLADVRPEEGVALGARSATLNAALERGRPPPTSASDLPRPACEERTTRTG